MVEQRLTDFADSANTNQRGGLDNPGLLLRYQPQGLRDVRHLTIGRHRIYYDGSYTDCNYRVFYVKIFKKKGVGQEGDPAFQRKLIQAMELSQSPGFTRLEVEPAELGQDEIESADSKES